jgi:predicted Zn-dependent protease
MCRMRMGKLMMIGLVVLLLVCSVPVAATADTSNNDKNNGNKPTMIVEYGTGKDLGLIKVTHIDYTKSESKGKPPQSAVCYKLAKWKWSSPVTYTLDSTVVSKDPTFQSALTAAEEKWDSHTSKDLFSSGNAGTGTAGVRDNKNLITFGNYAQNGVIAVTYTWYNPGTRIAVESDMLFDTDFNWGTTGEASLMDVQNIATHEMGHTLGLSDLYTDSCNTVTMYGYSTEGDTQKRTLEPPDIAGLQLIYGS